MARRKVHYVEKPWKPDPVKWGKHLHAKQASLKTRPDRAPKGGWQLWRWDTLEDTSQ